jgi:4-amino-4-deoxy-L-arabinose transferase-like glycosyltransferase
MASRRRVAVCVGAIYLAGVALRVWYTFVFRPPSASIYSDMDFYVSLARELRSGAALRPWHVTHPLGFPLLLMLTRGSDLTFAGPTQMQLAVSALVPVVAGVLGAAAFGRRTALAMIAVSSFYFPFIEYGALFLSEVHFIFWLALAFAAFLVAPRAPTERLAVATAFGGGIALSIAAVMKAVALPVAIVFFAVQTLGLRLGRRRLRLGLALAALLGVLPLVAFHASACTRANGGRVCVMGTKAGADFLLGHYGRVREIQWAGPDGGRAFHFSSPGSHLRFYSEDKAVPFALYDGPANAAEAWRFIGAHPLEALVLSLDHVFDAFFGVAMWPSFQSDTWLYADLSQWLFVVGLLLPSLWVLAKLARARRLLESRALLVLSPVFGLVVTVMIATGEVRYRVPFDLFFIAVACALAVGELEATPPAA